MASLVTEKQPEIGEVWQLKNDDTYLVYVIYSDVRDTTHRMYFKHDNTYTSLEAQDKTSDFIDRYRFGFKPNEFPKEVEFGGVFDTIDTTDDVSFDIFNNKDDFYDLSSDDENNYIIPEFLLDGDDNKKDKKKPTIKLKRTPKTDNKKTTITLKRPQQNSKNNIETKKRKNNSKTERTKQLNKKINWNYLSKNYDTLFYPKHNGKVVPQVMTIADVKPKETNRTSAKGPKLVYIFQVKHNNKNIDEEIERWSNWRRDYNSVNSWVQQIGRMIKNCEKDSQRNFLKALQRSFTITKRRFHAKEDKYESFKQEMAVCYVHFIKNKGTDHTWGKFKTYLKTKCKGLNDIFDTIKKEKERKNRDKKKVPTNRITKFASNAFHDYLEYVEDKTFNVLNNAKEEEAKTELAEMFGIAMPKSTPDGMGKAVTLLMAKLKF